MARRLGSVAGPKKRRVGAGGEFLVNPSKCLLEKGELLGADRRFKYKPYRCLTAAGQERARNQYPHSTLGIPASAYAYPIDKNGNITRAHRALMWGLKRVSRKVRRQQ